MSFALNPEAPVRYSQRELQVFNLLPKNGERISSKQIMSKLYRHSKTYHKQAATISAVGALTEKVIRNKEPFRIMKSEQRGPWPMEFWIEAK